MLHEKYIDMTEVGADHEVNKYLAHGWWIAHQGLTLTIMQKEFPPLAGTAPD